jgi:K+-transporting ATPase c subunit
MSIDLVTTTARGLDPHTSPEAAFVKLPRVATPAQDA